MLRIRQQAGNRVAIVRWSWYWQKAAAGSERLIADWEGDTLGHRC
jgi:hypothetical protein